MAVLTIPNLSINGYVPHTTANTGVGVPGGYERFRPGGADARTVEIDVEDSGADNTGATDSLSACATALALVGSQQVLKFGYGLFKFAGGLYIGNKSNFTVRGSGSGVRSTSSHTIGTGTKTFSVPAGLGWTSGMGVRVHKRQDLREWVQGVVIGYTGTSLGVDVTSTSGHSTTISDWIVSQTIIELTTAGSSSAFYIGLENGFYSDQADVLGSPEAGDTEITLSDASGYSSGSLIQFSTLRGDYEFDVYGWARSRVLTNRVESVAGNVITLKIPLHYDLPSELSPKVSREAFVHEFAGLEDMTIVASHAEYQGPMVLVKSAWGDWVHNVHTGLTTNYFITMRGSARCEIGYSSATYRSGAGSNGAGLLFASNTACLVRHSIFGNVVPAIEVNSGSCGNLFFANFGFGNNYNTNHGAHNSYNLYEANVVTYMQSDGYFGSCSRDTYFRNKYYGGSGSAGWQVLNRGNIEINSVGNDMGVDGGCDGVFALGEPFMGGGSNSGETSNVVTGDLPRHLDARGYARITGPIATRTSDDVATVTVPDGSLTSFSSPHYLNNQTNPFILRWGTEQGDYVVCDIDRAASSETLLKFTRLTGSAFPDAGTTLHIYPGPYGPAELDLAVSHTLFKKANYLASASGTGAVDEPLTGGDTLADSLCYPGIPFDWPPSLAWPPIVHTSPSGSTLTKIPAAVFWNSGEWPELGNNVATPVFIPSEGSYGTAQSVELETSTPGATIHFTTDGSTPTTGSPTYSTPISVTSGTVVIKALAVKSGMADSTVVSGTFTIVTAPTAPSGLIALAVSGTQINLIWSDNSDNETGFRIERRVGLGSWATVTTTAANATSYNNTGLSPGVTYEYRIFSVNAAGDSSTSSTDTETTFEEGSSGSDSGSGGVGEALPALRSARAPRYAIPRT